MGESRYDPDWDGPRLIWPPYARSQEESGLNERASHHLRSQYGSKLSMIDHWLGRVLSVVDRYDAWDTTAFILCTDHGHYLGERGTWGKPQVPVYPEMGHIPLLISWPGASLRTSDALTTTVDLHATLCDVFGVTPEHTTHGRSLVPLLDGTSEHGARMGTLRNLGSRSARRRRDAHVCQGSGRDESPTVDVLESMVDDAGARLPRHSSTSARQTRGAGVGTPESDVPE